MRQDIRVMIADDDELARARLRRLLRRFDDMKIVGEAGSARDAMLRIEEYKPSLLFLDPTLPDYSGFEVAAALPTPRPRIIFYADPEEHWRALDAFEDHMLDYALKPASPSQLGAAMFRAHKPLSEFEEGMLTRGIRAASRGHLRFLARKDGEIKGILARQVVCFRAEDGGPTTLCTPKDLLNVRPSLDDLERRLNPDTFLRITDDRLVRLKAVDEIVEPSRGCSQVVLRNGERLELPSDRLQQLKERLRRAR